MLTPERLAENLKKLLVMYATHDLGMAKEFLNLDYKKLVSSIHDDWKMGPPEISKVLGPVIVILRKHNNTALAGLMLTGEEKSLKVAVLKIFEGAAINYHKRKEAMRFDHMIYRLRHYHEEPDEMEILALLRNMGLKFQTEEEARDKEFRQWAGSSSPAWDKPTEDGE